MLTCASLTFVRSVSPHSATPTDRIEGVGVCLRRVEHRQGVLKRALVTVNLDHTIRYLWQTDTANTQITLDELHNTVRRLTH